MHSWEHDTIWENPLSLMRDSRRLGLDTEMFVPVTIAEPAGLNGEDRVKTADYSPLDWFLKRWDLSPGSLLHLSVFVAFQHLSFLEWGSKQII